MNDLDQLEASAPTLAKLRELGADSPLALLCMRQAATQAFDEHLGLAPSERDALLKGLESLLDGPDQERWRVWSQEPSPSFALGAQMQPRR